MSDLGKLDQLVLDHLPAALRFATRLTGDVDTGEELVQEALLRAVRRWTTFRGEAEFRTWLFRIIINVSRDRIRNARSTLLPIENQSLEIVEQASSEPVETAIQAEVEELVAREVSRLPPRQREVLTLIAFEELSVREVCDVVGISVANVYSTLSAARSRLKIRLALYLGSVER